MSNFWKKLSEQNPIATEQVIGMEECSNGIHFFFEKEDAENY